MFKMFVSNDVITARKVESKREREAGNRVVKEALDHESRLQGEDHQSIRLWLRLLTCTNMIEQRLRARLREEFAITLPRFDFMAQLHRVPEGLTMGELSQRMMVSGGNVSGIANQLVSEGLVSRSPVPDNRRTFCVKLTAEGRRRFTAMADAHESWVVEMLGDLSPGEHQQIMGLLTRLKSGVTGLGP